jgi:hypothetical protein
MPHHQNMPPTMDHTKRQSLTCATRKRNSQNETIFRSCAFQDKLEKFYFFNYLLLLPSIQKKFLRMMLDWGIKLQGKRQLEG